MKKEVPASLHSWLSCTRCVLGKYANHHVVGRGVLPCDVLFLGESPGRSEDAIGEAFVGRAGRLLDKAIGATDRRVFFANLTMCRGTDGVGEGNRAPTVEEIKECLPRLLETIRLGKPRGIVCAGLVPARAFEEFVRPGMLSWKLEPFPQKLNVPHPAYILRSGGEASLGWVRYCETIKEFMRRC